MRRTTPAFAPYTNERYVNFRVRFELMDVNAKAAALPSVSGEAAVSQLAQVNDGVSEIGGKWATLEHNLWALDGTFDGMPDITPEVQTGWWSDAMSDGNAVFEIPPRLSFSFGGIAISTVGFTLYFDDKSDNYPTSIRVTTYDAAGGVVNAKTLPNSGALCVLNMPSQNYCRVDFEFLATNLPHRRIRVTECLFGVIELFDGDRLVKASAVYGADIMSEAFPARQLTFVFENLDRRYNLINPEGIYAYLQQGQEIYAEAVINGEAVSMGNFLFAGAQANDNEITAQITAGDYVLPMFDKSVPDFLANGNTAATVVMRLEDAVNRVIEGLGIKARIATPDYKIQTAIASGTKRREIIRLFAQAAMCAVWVARDGVLRIEPLEVSDTAADELNADNMTTLAGITVAEPVDCVVLTVKDDYSKTEATYTAGFGLRVKTVSNPCVIPANGQAVADWLLAQQNRRVKYDKPNRGNPAVEVGDTLKIFDAYGENRNAVVTGLDVIFDGAFSTRVKAVGGQGLGG